MRVKLIGEKLITKATLESKTQEIAGECKITVPINTKVPSVSIEDGKGSSMVVLNFNTGLQLNSTTAEEFFFVFKPGTYEANDLVLTFYDNTGGYYRTELTIENTFNRSRFKTATRTYGDAEKGTIGTAGVEEANKALASGLNDVVVAESDNEPKIKLPASTSEAPTNLSFV